MSEAKKHEIQSKGGKASHSGSNASTSSSSTTTNRGAAGRTEAAKRGGENSHRS